MKSIILILSGVVVFLVAGFLLLNRGGSQLQTVPVSASTLEVFENDFDFGTISMKNGDVSKKFEIKNTGLDSVVVNKVYTSCMCTIAKITDFLGENSGPYGMPGHGGGVSRANIEIKPGEKIQVEAIFNPAAHGPSGVGLAQRTVYLETNSSKTPKVELNFKAVVTN